MSKKRIKNQDQFRYVIDTTKLKNRAELFSLIKTIEGAQIHPQGKGKNEIILPLQKKPNVNISSPSGKVFAVKRYFPKINKSSKANKSVEDNLQIESIEPIGILYKK